MRITEAMRGNWNFKGWKGLLPRMDIFVGVTAGVLIGLCLLIVGPLPTIGILLFPIVLGIFFKTPELPLLAMLAYTSGLIPSQFNPYINLGVGRFQISDLILISLLGLLALRLWAEPSFRVLKTPVTLPLILFCISVFGGIATAVTLHGINFSYTTYEARIFLYYTAFFVVVGLVRAEAQIKRLVYGVFVIGVLSVIIITTQTLQAGFGAEPVRAFHPGFTSILLAIAALFCLLAAERRRLNLALLLLAILALGVGMLTSLGRNIVISSAAGLCILWLLLRQAQRGRLLQGMAALILVAGFVFLSLRFFAPEAGILQYPVALVDRFNHLFTTDPLSSEETLLWRYNETQYAWVQISQSPWLGIGLKTQYRPSFYEGDQLQSYIHNGYLWLWLKTGLFGLLFFLWMLTAFLHRIFRKWQDIPDHMLRMASLGFAIALTVAMISNSIAPMLVERFNLAFFAVGMGVFEVSLALREKESLSPNAKRTQQLQRRESAWGGRAGMRSVAKRRGSS